MTSDGVRPQSPFGPPAVIAGLIRYRGEFAQPAYRLNCFLVWISKREHRLSYLADEEGAMAHWQLSEPQRALVRARDYPELLAAGANIYAIAKAGYVWGATLLEIGAQMRGETAQAFVQRHLPTDTSGGA